MATPSTSSTNADLGPFVRMHALNISRLPAHPDLASQQQGETKDIQSFASAALEEANTFMTSYVPNRFDMKSTDKKSPPSTADVKLLSRDIPASELPKEVQGAGEAESWFARSSLHENKATEGTASWEEFDFGCRVDHPQHEMEYTPDVQDAHEVLNWNSQLESSGRKFDGGWEDVHASIMEMVHHIPAPLNNRVFSVLVITARRGDSFVVVQLPVDAQGLPGTKYQDAPKLTGGQYVSIERGELVEDGKKTQWQMATCGDAKGVLPMWAQKMGMPGAVVKDVGLFIQWAADRRKKGPV
ncbi:hypothetical protein LTR37_016912 [Vermiconidia calcicola]|uniref:Uncharacterized protein n=1 Tax=Vermiconidia calcicola TaxID=1690605 RepID=A0ACC3MMQ3_9PEZI|nr:hypothetical protein LTR37_016912 [Vermiconidia calcicola]